MSDRQPKAKQFAELVESRGHTITNGIYRSNQSVLKIHCLKHKQHHTVSAGLYKKARTSVKCCCSAKQSATVTMANTKRKR